LLGTEPKGRAAPADPAAQAALGQRQLRPLRREMQVVSRSKAVEEIVAANRSSG
jgi:hypothetical protein